MAKILGSDQSPLAKIRSAMVESLAALEDDEIIRATDRLLFLKTELTDETKVLLEQVRSYTARVKEILEGLIRQGQKSGQIGKDLDPATASLALLGFSSGIEVLWLMEVGGFSIKEQGEALVDFALKTLDRRA